MRQEFPTNKNAKSFIGENIENELSPEVFESIMQKVQDIDKNGTAFTGLRDNNYESVFKQGVLGNSLLLARDIEVDSSEKYWKKYHNIDLKSLSDEEKSDYDDEFEYIQKYETPCVSFRKISDKERAERWKAILRQRNNAKTLKGLGRESALAKNETGGRGAGIARVYFNIVGRTKGLAENEGAHEIDGIKRISNTQWAGQDALIFDLNKFKENVEGSPERPGNYQVDLGEFKSAVNKRGESMVDEETGFYLSPRIAPRNFKGFVMNLLGDLSEEAKKTRVTAVVEMQKKVFQDKPELFIPIYDSIGNLLWPKKMSYKEVKKFVEEKTKK